MKAKQKRIYVICICVAILLVAVFYQPIITFLKQNDILRAEHKGNCLTVLDVGEADAILVQSDTKTALIDTGDVLDGGNALAVKLKKAGVDKIDVLVLTHGHTDHAGGLYEVLSQFEIGKFYHTGLYGEDNAAEDYFLSLRKIIREKDIKTAITKEDTRISVGEFKLDVIACGIDSGDDEAVNNASTVIRATCQGRSFLLMADAGEYTERYIVKKFGDITCDVLKVGHHGSNTASCKTFLKATKPHWAAISCGDKNTYGHPSDDVLERLEEYNAKVLRTDIHSDISFVVQNGMIVVNTAQ